MVTWLAVTDQIYLSNRSRSSEYLTSDGFANISIIALANSSCWLPGVREQHSRTGRAGLRKPDTLSIWNVATEARSASL